jgi:hypothetical protein
VAVLVAAIGFGASKLELAVLLLAITFVLVAELVNTAVEAVVDVASTSFDPLAKIAKDIAAGAVLVAALNAVAVGYLVFSGEVATRSSRFLTRLHCRSMLVPEHMQDAVHERRTPLVADHLRAEDDVTDRARHALGHLVAPVERKREHVRRLVDPEVLVLQCAHLVGADEGDPELAVVDALLGEDGAGELLRGTFVDRRAAAVRGLDEDHRRRAVPVSSA